MNRHPEHAPIPESLESLLSLRAQYEERIRGLNQTGVLELLPKRSALGVVGIDNQEYPLPEYEKLLEAIKENESFLKEKKEQGFNQLLIVPIAAPLEVLILRYKRALKKHYQEKKLFGRNKETGQREPLELDLNQPVYVWDGYKESDEQGKLIYYPRSFTPNHQGQTKQQLIASSIKSSLFPGWEVKFISDTDIPRAGQGQTKGGRKELEAGQSPEEYLKLFQTDPIYQKEQGLTPEDWLTYALTVLEERDEVIDDWQSQGSISYLTGAYFPASSYVPSAYWSRGFRQASVDGGHPGDRLGNCGARAAVRVEKGGEK